jgi:hypothetical protein
MLKNNLQTKHQQNHCQQVNNLQFQKRKKVISKKELKRNKNNNKKKTKKLQKMMKMMMIFQRVKLMNIEKPHFQ